MQGLSDARAGALICGGERWPMQRPERLQSENVGATDRGDTQVAGGETAAHVKILLYCNPSFCIRNENLNPS